MARLRTLLAICLALVLAFSSTTAVWAGGPSGTNANTLPADGGDGHPWDDGTTENNTNPGDDIGTDPADADQLLMPMFTRSVNPGGADWLQGLIVKLWRSIAPTKIGRVKTGSRIERLK